MTLNKSHVLLSALRFISCHSKLLDDYIKFIFTSVPALIQHFYFSSKEHQFCDREPERN
jgi:hypothetical protein